MIKLSAASTVISNPVHPMESQTVKSRAVDFEKPNRYIRKRNFVDCLLHERKRGSIVCRSPKKRPLEKLEKDIEKAKKEALVRLNREDIEKAKNE